MTSARYALPVAIVLMLAIIPTVIHSYLGLKTDDGLSVKNIKSELDNFNSEPTKRQPGWGDLVRAVRLLPAGARRPAVRPCLRRAAR